MAVDDTAVQSEGEIVEDDTIEALLDDLKRECHNMMIIAQRRKGSLGVELLEKDAVPFILVTCAACRNKGSPRWDSFIDRDR